MIKEDRYTTTEGGYTITIWGAGDKHDWGDTNRGVIYNTLRGLRVSLLEDTWTRPQKSYTHGRWVYLYRGVVRERITHG